MKNQFLILAIIFFVAIINAQQKPALPSVRGTTPLNTHSSSLITSSTYAVVVGISDYQDPAIPDLRFADKDAEIFANYLRSDAGGKLDQDHLRVLINQQATMAQFANALDWLWENCKEGDEAIIYFSGHGDVEKKSLSQPGFLLCWDAPAHVYMAGGAFALPMLQEVISTLSIQHNARVIVITDACHSGVLAGSSVGGAQATTANLARQYANEIKIMSCQPNEFSIEGEQWGGGRGAFSYHLIDGLYGLADFNDDQGVTLQELGRYLEDHVSTEVAPVSQVPIIVGNRNERLNSVNPKLVADIKSGKTNQSQMLFAINSKGIEDEVLLHADESIQKVYQQFKQSIQDKVFLAPANACADFYYNQLIQNPAMQRLHSTMKRNYAAALQDDAQQVMNRWLKTDIKEIYLSRKHRKEKYQLYPRYLERAAELLGSGHYMYKTLMSRSHLFEAYNIALTDFNFNPDVGQRAIKEFREALDWQPESPHVYWLMSRVFALNLLKADSSDYYGQKAIQMLPGWLLPYVSLAYVFHMKFKNSESVKEYLKAANLIDSNSTLVRDLWAAYYKSKFQYTLAEQNALKALEADSSNTYACVLLSDIYSNTKRMKQAEEICKRAIRLDSTYGGAWTQLGNIYAQSGKNVESENMYRRAFLLDSLDVNALIGLGIFHASQKKWNDAEREFLRIIQIDSTYDLAWDRLASLFNNTGRVKQAEEIYLKLIQKSPNENTLHYNLACLYSRQDQIEKGFASLENALKIGMSDYKDWLQQDPDLSQLRAHKEEWDAMMKKYFSDK